MIKKGFCILLATWILLCLTACSTQAESKPIKIGICIHDGKDAFEQACAQALSSLLTEKGYAVSLADGKKNQSIQNSHVQNWIAQGYDAMILSPVIPAAADNLVTQLRTARIPVIFTCREPDGAILSEWDRVCYVGCDTAQPGALLAQQVLALPEQGDITGDGVVSCVLIQNTPDRIDTHLRTRALRRTFESSEAYIQIQDVLYAGSDPERSQALCAGRLSKTGAEIDVILCSNPRLAQGALSAIEAAGRQPGNDIYLFCANGTEASVQQICAHKLTGTVLPSADRQAAKTAQALELLLTGQPVQQRYYADHIPVTTENAQKYLADAKK